MPKKGLRSLCGPEMRGDGILPHYCGAELAEGEERAEPRFSIDLVMEASGRHPRIEISLILTQDRSTTTFVCGETFCMPVEKYGVSSKLHSPSICAQILN